MKDTAKKFIFFDRAGRRWPRLRTLIFLFVSLLMVGGVLFVHAMFVAPKLKLPKSVSEMKGEIKMLKRPMTPPSYGERPLQRLQAFTGTRQAGGAQGAGKSAYKISHKNIRLGFYAGWDSRSHASLIKHGGLLTHVCSDWFTLEDGLGRISEVPDARLLETLKSKNIAFLPMLNNLWNDEWQPEPVENLSVAPAGVQERFAASLAQSLEKVDADGVLINWQMLDSNYKQDVTALLKRIADGLHGKQMELWIAVPMGAGMNVFELDALSEFTDRFVALMHDENSEVDDPGPLASQDWFDGWMNAVLAYGNSRQWVIAIGSYGYDWRVSATKKDAGERAEMISFSDSLARAAAAGVSDIGFSKPDWNPHFSYQLGEDERAVWFLDAASFLNQWEAAHGNLVGGVGVYRMGLEDPAIWSILKQPVTTEWKAEKLKLLSNIQADDRVAQVGDGEFVSVDVNMRDGYRAMARDNKDYVLSEYKLLPNYATLFHWGNSRDEVAITFDDGPDPEWTAKILDVLKEKKAPAAFFVLGRQAEREPEILQRIAREGHEIGNHSFFHPDLSRVSLRQAELELNACQRIIEAITDRSTILFRPPYIRDSHPYTVLEAIPVEIAQDMNYLTVAANIDPRDYERPGAVEILNRVKAQRRFGNIILMHDAGGDRSQTVAALPEIIDYLRERGDRIVSLGDLAGLKRDAIMPPLYARGDDWAQWASDSGFQFFYLAEKLLWSFTIVATVLLLLRMLLIAALAMQHRKMDESRRAERAGFHPPVSVLIAAYNEEKVIRETLRCVLASTHPAPIEVVVVDDGSKDGTAAAIREVSGMDRRVLCIRQPNKGKAEALREGLRWVKHETVVMLDADTQFEPSTISELAAFFKDSKVGSVSGHARVGNARNFLSKCQDLEYVCGFNLDRRAYAAWNCITVIPGAVGAFRRSAIEKAGGICSETLAEDTDLTLSLHRVGYRAEYAPDAVAYTEAPEKIRALVKQRFRWVFGTMQCLWKHRDLVLNHRLPALGYLSLPSIWFFQILLVAMIPLMDALLILSLFIGLGWEIYAYFVVFLMSDLLLAMLACWIEREPLRKTLWMVPMRFLYRPLLSWVVWKAIYTAFKGVLVDWGKLERTASVVARQKRVFSI